MYASIFALDMAEKTTTIRMDTRTMKRIDGLARAMSRSRAWVINRAVEQYLEYEEWFVAEVEKGLEEASAGNLIDHDAVVKRWERKRAVKMDTRR